MSIHNSNLYKDLISDLRDAMYCAMTYITRCGGPSIAGPADDLVNLQANRETMLEWLLAQRGKDKIVEEYAEYKERWSPVFMD
jgi:hypothetical protein